MLAHPLSVYSPKNHSPIWGYMFLAGCAYIVFKKDENLALPSVLSNPLVEENPSTRKQRLYKEMFSEFDELGKYLSPKLEEIGFYQKGYAENTVLAQIEKIVKGTVQRATELYHSPQQMTHVLRIYRAMHVYENLERLSDKIEEIFEERLPSTERMEKIYNKLIKDMKKVIEGATLSGDEGYIALEHNSVRKFFHNNYLEHIFATAKENNISEILNFNINHFYSPRKLENALREIENRWIEKQREKEPAKLKEGETFVDCGNGFKWVYLDEPTCDMEANAMAHCGNRGGDDNDRILSLRETKRVKGKSVTLVHLTFIGKEYDSGERTLSLPSKYYILEEMKGFGNSKPSEKYHPQVMDLLLDQRILYVMGGGYAPEKNFSLDDLSDKNTEILKRQKPHFYDHTYFLKDEMLSRSTILLNAIFNSSITLKKSGNSYIIDEFNNFEEFEDLCDEGTLGYFAPLPERRNKYTRTTEDIFGFYDSYIKDDEWLHDYLSDYYHNWIDEDEKNIVNEIIHDFSKSGKGRRILKFLEKEIKDYDKNLSLENFYQIYADGTLGEIDERLFDYFHQAIQDSFSHETYRQLKKSFASAIDGLDWGDGLYINLKNDSIDDTIEIRISEKNFSFYFGKLMKYGKEDSYELLFGKMQDGYRFDPPINDLEPSYDYQEILKSVTNEILSLMKRNRK